MKQIDANTRQLLYTYLDNELSNDARQKFEARLSNEPLLAAALQEEEQLRIRLQSHVRQHHAPTSLRNRVKEALSSSTSSATRAPALPPAKMPSWWRRFTVWWRTPLRLQPALFLSYTVFWFVILGSVLVATRPALGQVPSLTPVSTPASENHSVFRQLAGKHGVYFAIDDPLDVRGTNRDIINWFQTRVPYPITIPALSGWTLKGARLGEFHHQGTVHLLYRRADENLSLTLFLPRDSDFPQDTLLKVKNNTFFAGDDGQRHAILWRHDETGYALVGDSTLTREELLPIATEASQQQP